MEFDPQPLPKQVVIASDLRAARAIEEKILRLTRRLGYSRRCGFAIRLALEEAIVNAHKHGNKSDPSKTITISYDVNEERAIIRVRDDGMGFARHQIPDPTSPDRIMLTSGRGIKLMEAYMDDLCYNDRGNEVQLTKNKA